MIGAEVTELIQGYVLGMTLETTEAELAHTVFAHPTAVGDHARSRAGRVRQRDPRVSPAMKRMNHQRGALSDLRIVDLTQMLAGPICTQMLADHGAEVIKVESLAGDGIRSSGPFRPDDAEHAFGGYFQSVNRNKSSIVLDLKQEEGKAILRAPGRGRRRGGGRTPAPG